MFLHCLHNELPFTTIEEKGSTRSLRESFFGGLGDKLKVPPFGNICHLTQFTKSSGSKVAELVLSIKVEDNFGRGGRSSRERVLLLVNFNILF